MKSRTAVLLIVGATWLSGCAVSHPQTAQEFRAAVPGSYSAKVESFQVTRAFPDVAKTFAKKAAECLKVAVRTESRTNMSYQVYTATYKPTVVMGTNKVELHVQQHIDNTVKVSEEPPGGYYMLVADAYPAHNGTTRVDLYRPAMGYDVLTKAVKGWASGENLSCPDMTKT